jgi:hypothetical protein
MESETRSSALSFFSDDVADVLLVLTSTKMSNSDLRMRFCLGVDGELGKIAAKTGEHGCCQH